ncbi:hypothetical protein DRQ09_07150 [candidate division KSB1 bacterium]|nr:MAG: hypothetical protein DRQ09_07150 [candidate division KSB1 bacterium]
MKEKIEQLQKVLEEEIVNYKKLLTLLLKERKLLTEANVEVLENNLKEQEKVFTVIDRLECERFSILEELSKEILGDSFENTTIDELFSRIPDSDRLKNIRNRLKELVRDIIKINNNNDFLIRNGLSFIEKNIEAFFGVDGREDLYHPGKFKLKKKNAKNIINWKI